LEEPKKPSQMKIARAYVAAFILGGLATMVPIVAIVFALFPGDQALAKPAALAAGLLGGALAASIAPVRVSLARIVDFLILPWGARR